MPIHIQKEKINKDQISNGPQFKGVSAGCYYAVIRKIKLIWKRVNMYITDITRVAKNISH